MFEENTVTHGASIITTTTTTITKTKPKHCYDNISQKRKWTVAGDLNTSIEQQNNTISSQNQSFSSANRESSAVSMKRNRNHHDTGTERGPSFKTLNTLKSHLDTITSLFFNANLNVLASASEDRTIKLWKSEDFGKSLNQQDDASIQPYLTFRGHKDHIFSMTGSPDSQFHFPNLLYSGGSNGTLLVWKIPPSKQFDMNLDTSHLEYAMCPIG